MNKLQQESRVDSQNTDDNLKIPFTIVFIPIQTFHLVSIYVAKPCMSGHRLTLVGYTLQKDVETFGNLILPLAEECSTNISSTEYLFTHSISIKFPGQLSLSTGVLPSKEFLEHWLHASKV
jgi:hypothetical protein